MPVDRWDGATIPIPATFPGAGRQAAQAERDSTALYDRLLPRFADSGGGRGRG